VFRNRSGGPREHRHVQRAFETARTRAGLVVTEDGEAVLHSLRHTGISRLANHPAIALVQVRDFARHANLATTQGYVHKIDSPAVTQAIGEALGG
jgi:integrase